MERTYTEDQDLGQMEIGRISKRQLHLSALWKEGARGEARATSYLAEGTLQEEGLRCRQWHYPLPRMSSVHAGAPQERAPARQEVASNRREEQEGDDDEAC